MTCVDFRCPYVNFCRYFPNPVLQNNEYCLHQEQITIRAKNYLKYLESINNEKEGDSNEYTIRD